jgi:hypothetical protein
MPLEETQCRSKIASMLLRDQLLKDGGHRGVFTSSEVAALESALHHLEAGKRDAERLDKIEAIGELEGFRTFGGKFSFITSDVFEAPTLREAIDLAITTPTEEPQG